MFSIVVHDLLKKRKFTVAPIAHYSKCLSTMEELAENFIYSVEGEKYFKGPLYRKTIDIKKGHGLVRHEYGIYSTIDVYRREPNGIIYSGEIIKIIEFSIIPMPPAVHEPRESLMDDESYDKYQLVIKMINECVPKFDICGEQNEKK